MSTCLVAQTCLCDPQRLVAVAHQVPLSVGFGEDLRWTYLELSSFRMGKKKKKQVSGFQYRYRPCKSSLFWLNQRFSKNLKMMIHLLKKWKPYTKLCSVNHGKKYLKRSLMGSLFHMIKQEEDGAKSQKS